MMKVAGGFAVSVTRLTQKCSTAGGKTGCFILLPKSISSTYLQNPHNIFYNGSCQASPFFLSMNNIFLKWQSDPHHAGECDDADAA